jgi:hypothetical protein
MILIDYPMNGWCHLVADNIESLHEFAKKIDVKRCWFHNKRRAKRPHYDIREAKLKLALDNGAKLVTSFEVVLFLKKHYA